MFCPNCGQDCGDARFCTGCGTQLQQAVAQESKKAAWTVGTPCPYCGGVGLNGNCCAFCGVQLISEDTAEKKTKKELEFPEPPIGKYKYVDGYLEIGKESVTIYKNHIFKKYTTTIPYHEISAVTFGDGQLDVAGFLCVRSIRNRTIPPATTASAAAFDSAAIYFPAMRSEEFYPVYVFLKKCSDVVNAAET